MARDQIAPGLGALEAENPGGHDPARGRDWLFSIKTFAAAMLAVYIGLLMSLPRPYWAMATVYICSQPLVGRDALQGVFRVVGTLIGAIAAVVLVPTLANAPVLLVGALTLWVGGLPLRFAARPLAALLHLHARPATRRP